MPLGRRPLLNARFVETHPELESYAGGGCVQRFWTRKMSTFGNNLIERLRTKVVDV
jgi:hypothetical protein